MTTTEIEQPTVEEIAEIVGAPVGALAIRPDQTKFDDTQRAALAHIGLSRCPDADVEAFLHICQRTRLDPWTRQIYLIERGGKWTPQTAIDGFRVIAERREEFAGTTDIEWCDEDGVWTKVWLKKGADPYAARCSAKRHDRDDPITTVALFAEFTAGNAKWKTSPAHMIGKCAEAGCLRRAFPQDFAGLFIPEETDALTAQSARTKVASQRGPSGPVDNSELTGQPVPKTTPKKSDTSKDAGGDKMAAGQQKRLFALIREAKVGDRNAYASRFLGREITSYGQLSQGDAAALIENLEGMLAGDDEQPVEAEVVDEAPAGEHAALGDDTAGTES